MTDEEDAVLEAVVELYAMQCALDCGSPAEEKRQEAYLKLMNACDAWASENDGELRISG